MPFARRPRQPIPVLIVAGAYLAIGVIGFVVHFREALAVPSEGVWMELTEIVAVICGVFLLRGRDWARWLAIAWIVFHVALSIGNLSELAMHTVLAVAITWLLFRADTAGWFRPPRAEPG